MLSACVRAATSLASTAQAAYRYLRLLALMPPDENSGLRKQLETPLRHACEQSVPSGKANQNPAYARTSVLTEAAHLCLQIDCGHLLSTCLIKVLPPTSPQGDNKRNREKPPLCQHDAIAAVNCIHVINSGCSAKCRFCTAPWLAPQGPD
jgi:hypothetical protein